MRKVDVTTYSVAFENLPASFDGCRIGFLADFHNNWIKDNNKLFDIIYEEKYDYIFCGGDMVVGSDRGYFQYENAIPFLKELQKTAPIYYSLGNHEERMRRFYTDATERKTVWEEYRDKLLAIGITVLDNNFCQIKRGKESICLSGLSLSMEYYKRWWNRKTLTVRGMKEKINKTKEFTILLAHNPVYFDTYDAFQAELVLSGHIHGGLMIIPGIGGVISPEHVLFPKYDSGYFKGKKSQMIITRGLGTHTLPIRINNKPEINTITLKRACDFNGLLVK